MFFLAALNDGLIAHILLYSDVLISDGCTHINPTMLLVVLLLSPPVGTLCIPAWYDGIHFQRSLFYRQCRACSGGFAGLIELSGVTQNVLLM